MAAHRPGVRLPDQMIDRQAAARSGVHTTRDHDHDPVYSGETACWPEGAMDDPGRHVGEGANPCWGLAIDDLLVSYSCRGCGCRFHGGSVEAVRAQVLAHQGRTE